MKTLPARPHAPRSRPSPGSPARWPLVQETTCALLPPRDRLCRGKRGHGDKAQSSRFAPHEPGPGRAAHHCHPPPAEPGAAARRLPRGGAGSSVSSGCSHQSYRTASGLPSGLTSPARTRAPGECNLAALWTLPCSCEAGRGRGQSRGRPPRREHSHGCSASPGGLGPALGVGEAVPAEAGQGEGTFSGGSGHVRGEAPAAGRPPALAALCPATTLSGDHSP